MVAIHLNDETSRETDDGVYAVEGDRLHLASSSGGHGPHELRVQGDSLTLATDGIVAVVLRLVGMPRPVLVRGR